MVITTTLCALALTLAFGEEEYYEVATIPTPDDLVLEVSGIEVLEDGTALVATRRGNVYRVTGAWDDDVSDAQFHLYAQGLQEPLGLLSHEGWVYVMQRGELSRMRDTRGDGRIDELETVCDLIPISGNYHEYSFGPAIGPDGNFWVTTNKPFGNEPFGRAEWRGFTMSINDAGEMHPTCSGLRSPAGVETSPWGDVFYTDNQGEWCGASKLSIMKPGDFHGHPHGIASCKKEEWTYSVVENVPDGKLFPEVKKEIPELRLPAVWFPYDKMGRSPAGMAWDMSEGEFGPFAGHLFVTDQYDASVMRVSLEEVNGNWQGACYPFRMGLQCGAIRCEFGPDNSLLVGQTNRGWGGRGNKPYGLQRLRWTGVTPFELHTMSAIPGGFRLRYTAEILPLAAMAEGSFKMKSYTYKLHSPYGSPEVDTKELVISGVKMHEDGLGLDLSVEGLRSGYVHELNAGGVRSKEDEKPVHKMAYYTLIELAK
jgi:glucose/arabinose dehydrogenase